MNVDHLKKQHEGIYQLISEIESSLNISFVESNAFNLSLKLGQLSGKLTMHLRSEDDFLYPFLTNSSDQKLRGLGTRFSREMNGIAEKFSVYKTNYLAANKIKADSANFIQDTHEIFEILKVRLETEDRSLYSVLT